MDKVNLREKLALFDELWSPRIVGELNGQQIKLAKLQGKFAWHHHEAEDEMFLVVEGRLTVGVADRGVFKEHVGPADLEEGQVVLRGRSGREVVQRLAGFDTREG